MERHFIVSTEGDKMHTIAGVLTGVFLVFQSVHLEAAEKKKLIQFGDQQKKWMTDFEVQAFVAKLRSQGRHLGFMDITEHQEKKTSQVRSTLRKAVPDQALVIDPLLPLLKVENLEGTVKTLSDFKTRHARTDFGVQSARWIVDQFKSMAKGRPGITVQLFSHSFKQPSVIVRISGKGRLAKETVILGAHQDSIAQWGNTAARAPGADDDASGIATLLEVFRILIQSGYQPDRTLEFISYAGEELGLLGSQDIAKKYVQDKTAVTAVLQLDMTMYPDSTKSMTLMRDYTDAKLNSFVKLLIDRYVQIAWKEDKCGYGCSDHASWNAVGIPAVMPFEAAMHQDNPHIHTEKDTFDKLSSDFGLHFAKLALAFAIELGTGE